MTLPTRAWGVPSTAQRGRGLTRRGWGLLLTGGGVSAAASALGQRDVLWLGLALLILPALSAAAVLVGGRHRPTLRTVSPLVLPVGGTLAGRLTLSPALLTTPAEVTEEMPWGPSPCFEVAALPGSPPLVFRYHTTPTTRGRALVGPVRWTFRDPFGLAAATHTEPDRLEVVVTPAVHPLSVDAAGSGLGLAGDSSGQTGSQLDPDDALIRDYRPGDDTRRIHWRSTARSGDLMVRREERTWEPSACVLVDSRTRAPSGKGAHSTLERTISAAASIAVHLMGSGHQVSVADASGRSLFVHQRGESAEQSLLVHLADLQPAPDAGLDAAVRGCRQDGRNNLLIAVTGRLTTADAATLALAGQGAPGRWAFVHEVAGDSSAPARQLLAADGWVVVAVSAGMPVAQAWDLARSQARMP